MVGETGTVCESISADTVRVSGTVKGDVTATAVTLTRTARVEGNLIHQALVIEPGANFEGHCRSIGGNGRPQPQKLPLIVEANAGEWRSKVSADPTWDFN